MKNRIISGILCLLLLGGSCADGLTQVYAAETETSASETTESGSETAEESGAAEDSQAADKAETADKSQAAEETEAAENTQTSDDTKENEADTQQADTEDASDALPAKHCTGYVDNLEGYVPDTVTDAVQDAVTDGIYADADLATVPATTIAASKYRNTNLTAVKNQDSWNLCWCFSTVACAEADLIQNSGADVNTIDLSEIQLAYFVANPVRDPLGFMDPAEIYRSDFNDGGNYEKSSGVIAQGMCLTDESVAPLATATSSMKLPASKAYMGQYSLENAYFVSNTDRDSIKQAILDYGAVGVCYFYDGTGESGSNSQYYYYPEENSVNHAVTIVGWDDSISAKKFNGSGSIPSENGAWIVRNSWGDWYGNDGYFYLSYDDPTIDNYLVAFDVSEGAVADNIYQYDFNDGAYYNPDDEDEVYTSANQFIHQKVANVFEAQANDTGYESLEAVSFFTYKGNSDYVVKIYTNLSDPEDPESGKLVANLTGTLDAAGYRTLYLKDYIQNYEENPILLKEGEKYSVVVTTTKFVSAKKFGKGAALGVAGEMGLSPSSESGQTFYMDAGDAEWTDSTDSINARIKAFTNNASYSGDPTGISFDQESYTITGIGSTRNLKVDFAPVGTSGDVTYTSSDESVATVNENGTVTAKALGTATITATCGSLTATCAVNVVSGLKLSLTTTAEKVSVSWNKIDDAAKYQVSYTSQCNYDEYGDVDNPSGTVDLDASTFTYDLIVNKTGVYRITVAAIGTDGTVLSQKSASAISQLPAIEDIECIFQNTTSLGLSWGASEEADKYTVYIYNANRNRWVAKTATEKTSCIITGLTAGTEYKISVGYKNSDDNGVDHSSELANSVTVSTLESGIGGIAVSKNDEDAGIDIEWSTMENAKCYKLMQMSKLSDYDWEVAGVYKESDADEDGCYAVTLTEDNSTIQSGYTYYYRLNVYSDEAGTTLIGHTSGQKILFTSSYSKALLELNLKAVNGASGIELSWTATDTAKKYNLYRVDLETDAKTALKSNLTGSESYTYVDKAVTSGQRYYYQVEEYSGDAYIGKTKTVVQEYLSRPWISECDNDKGGVTIYWDQVEGADQYLVYRKVSSSGTYSLAKTVNGGAVTYCKDTKATAGSRNYYYIVAVDGSTKSMNSNTSSVTYIPAVTSFSLANTSAGVQVTWKTVTGIAKYRVIYYDDDYNSKSVTVSASSDASQSTVLKSLTNGVHYTISVFGVSGSSLGYGEEKEIVRLSATSISTLKNSSAGKMTVGWKKNSKVTGYQIQYSTSKSFSGAKTVTVSGASSVSKTISSLTKGKTYYVRIRSYKKVSGTTYYSGWSSGKTLKITK